MGWVLVTTFGCDSFLSSDMFLVINHLESFVSTHRMQRFILTLCKFTIEMDVRECFTTTAFSHTTTGKLSICESHNMDHLTS